MTVLMKLNSSSSIQNTTPQQQTQTNKKLDDIVFIIDTFPMKVAMKIIEIKYGNGKKQKQDLFGLMQLLYTNQYHYHKGEKTRLKRFLGNYYGYMAPLKFNRLGRMIHGVVLGTRQQHRKQLPSFFTEYLLEKRIKAMMKILMKLTKETSFQFNLVNGFTTKKLEYTYNNVFKNFEYKNDPYEKQLLSRVRDNTPAYNKYEDYRLKRTRALYHALKKHITDLVKSSNSDNVKSSLQQTKKQLEQQRKFYMSAKF